MTMRRVGAGRVSGLVGVWWIIFVTAAGQPIRVGDHGYDSYITCSKMLMQVMMQPTEPGHMAVNWNDVQCISDEPLPSK